MNCGSIFSFFYRPSVAAKACSLPVFELLLDMYRTVFLDALQLTSDQPRLEPESLATRTEPAEPDRLVRGNENFLGALRLHERLTPKNCEFIVSSGGTPMASHRFDRETERCLRQALLSETDPQ